MTVRMFLLSLQAAGRRSAVPAAIVLLLGSGTAAAAELKGVVLDIETRSRIAHATVELVGQSRLVASDSLGEFRLADITASRVTLHVSHVAYKDNTVAVDLSHSQPKLLAVYLFPKTVEGAAVVVIGEHQHSKFEELSKRVGVLEGRDLQREMGLTLASALKNETGLAIRAMGPAPARPVIRGLGGDRVSISEDGAKTVDLSATSPDHAVTIEPFAVERVEVVRGPRVLLQTPTTIGGVVNVVRHEVPDVHHDQIYGVVGVYAESANRGALGSFLLDLPLHPLALRGEFSRRSAGDLTTPVGRLTNSDSRTTDLSFGSSIIDDFGFAGYSFRQFALDYGVPGGFIGAHPRGVDIEMLKRQHNVRAEVAVGTEPRNRLRLQLSRTYYRHKEFEASGLVGSEFRIHDVSGRLDLNHRVAAFMPDGTAGISFETRDFNIGGFVFTPRSKSHNIAVYIFETLTSGRIQSELAFRAAVDQIRPDDPRFTESEDGVKKRDFTTWSASGSLMYSLSEHNYLGANLSRSSRVSTIEELYSDGPHLAAYSYEVGNPNLDVEHGVGAEVFAYHKSPRLYLMLTGFLYEMDYFIIPRNTGEINFQTFLPIYRTAGVTARLKGVEGLAEIQLLPDVMGTVSAGYTRGNFRDGGPLPQIPPAKVQLELKYSDSRFSGGGNVQLAARQDRLDDFEQPTPGYAVFSVFTQLVLTSGSQVHSISLNLDNVLNKEHRNHLSRVKSILPEAGRNLRATYKLFFGY